MTWLGKIPPRIDNGLHQNREVDVFGRVVQSSTSPKQVMDPRTFSSVKTIGFETIARNQLPMQPFTASTRIMTDTGGELHWNSSYYENGVTYDGIPVYRIGSTAFLCGAAREVVRNLMPSPIGNIVIETAKQRALSKCANMKMNLAQSFAERKQTANLLINNLNRFVAFAALARKGKFSEANKLLHRTYRSLPFQPAGGGDTLRRFRKDTLKRPTQDEFANLWLEYSYGWRPLLSDIYGAAELLAQSATKSRPMSAKGSCSMYDDKETAFVGSNSQGAARGYHHSHARAIVEFFFDIDNALLDVLKSTGLTNPLLLAWELVPYSFCVDWVLPVGTYLKNWNATHGLRFVKGYQSYRFTQRQAGIPTRNGYGIVPERGGPGRIDVQWEYLKRTPLQTFPAATLPRFDLGLNISQVTSALALLNQIFRR